jgi:hypothetical protein
MMQCSTTVQVLTSEQEILSDALLMKNRFLIASKAAALYNEVSQAFVIPGVRWVAGLCLIDLPDDVIEEKVEEIEIWRAKICNGAEKLISKVSIFTASI